MATLSTAPGRRPVLCAASLSEDVAALHRLEGSYLHLLPRDLVAVVAKFRECAQITEAKRQTRSLSVVFIGEPQAGISSLVHCLAHGKAHRTPKRRNTTAAAAERVDVLHGDEIYTMKLLDAPCLSAMRRLLKTADACVVVTDKATMPWASFWLRFARTNSRRSGAQLLLALCCTKQDDAELRADSKIANKIAKGRGALYLEASAKTGHNVSAIATAIVERTAPDRSPDLHLSQHSPLPCHVI